MRFWTTAFGMLCATVSLVGVGLTADNATGEKSVRPTIRFSLLDLNGATHALDQNDGRRVRAFVFVSTECPVSNGYLKTLNELHARFANRGVDFFGIVADPTVTRAQAARHFTDFQAKFPVLFDASGQLRDTLRPTHVPESF
ncbi:MAG TPA: redoxin domain-containing protein, partial [Pirellulaceae bacterium]|nr:redoxin domain-containing protein [Pirellulaceae bacterium]